MPKFTAVGFYEEGHEGYLDVVEALMPSQVAGAVPRGVVIVAVFRGRRGVDEDLVFGPSDVLELLGEVDLEGDEDAVQDGFEAYEKRHGYK